MTDPAAAAVDRQDIRSIACPAISTGVFGCPAEHAAEVAECAYDAETAAIYRAIEARADSIER